MKPNVQIWLFVKPFLFMQISFVRKVLTFLVAWLPLNQKWVCGCVCFDVWVHVWVRYPRWCMRVAAGQCEGECVFGIGLPEGYCVILGHLFPSFQDLCLLLPYSHIFSFTLISLSAKIATKASHTPVTHAGRIATLQTQCCEALETVCAGQRDNSYLKVQFQYVGLFHRLLTPLQPPSLPYTVTDTHTHTL